MNRLNRRQLLQSTAWAAGALAVRGSVAQARPERRSITLVVEDRAGFQQVPVLLAEQLGYFRSEGLNLKVVEATADAPAWQWLANGSADVAAGLYEDTLLRQPRGQWLQAFVLQSRVPQLVLGVSPKTVPYFRGPVDLRGRRIGVATLGGAAHRVVLRVLARAEVQADEVSFVEVGQGWPVLNPYRSGQIDALCGVDPVLTTLEQRGEIRVVLDGRSLRETQEWFGGPWPSGCLYAPEEFLQKQGPACQALANAVVHALKWLQTAGPSDIIKTVPERYLLGDRALYLAVLSKLRTGYSPDGLMPPEGPQTLWRLLQGFDERLRAERVAPERSYNNEWAARAKARFKA